MNQYGRIQAPPFKGINKVIIAVVVILFILEALASKVMGLSISSYLGLNPSQFFSGHIYEIITYPLVPRGLMEVIFNSLLIWFLGSELEGLWGKKRYSIFLLFAIIGGAIVYLSTSIVTGSIISLVGLGGVCSALCIAYAVLFPDREFAFMMIFPIKAKYFCFIIIAMELYMGAFTSYSVLAFGHLGSMLFGFACMLLMSNPKTSHLFKTRSPKVKVRKGRGKLSLVKDEDDTPPKYWH